MIVHFKSPEYSFLSNFTLVNIEYDGIIYPSVEHAYMSAKSDDVEWKKYCSNFNISPADVKKNSRYIKLVDGWNDKKLMVMEKCLRKKFEQEPFRSQLLATGNQNIQEGNWWGDKFWGVDLKESPNMGENHLGRLIMKIRDEFWNIEIGGTLN